MRWKCQLMKEKNDISLISNMWRLTRHRNGLQLLWGFNPITLLAFCFSWTNFVPYFVFLANQPSYQQYFCQDNMEQLVLQMTTWWCLETSNNLFSLHCLRGLSWQHKMRNCVICLCNIIQYLSCKIDRRKSFVK